MLVLEGSPYSGEGHMISTSCNPPTDIPFPLRVPVNYGKINEVF